MLAADVVGVVAMVVRRNRVALFLVVMAAVSAVAVIVDPAGKLYNVRFLPLWFLCIYLLAGYALAEVVSAVARLVAPAPAQRVGAATSRHRLGSVRRTRLVAGRPGHPVPATRAGRGGRRRRGRPARRPGRRVPGRGAAAGPCRPPPWPRSGSPSVADQPSAWAAWNYSGYERKPDYPEFQAVIQMMRSVGAEQGCGRAMWEYDPSLNRFGTTESLMLLPYFTNGCIDSMEGLLFESASTTPFHFINQNELSPNPSDAVVGLPYGGLNVPLGIQHLQLMGVRYLLASSTTVENAAAADPAATLIGTTGPWSTTYNGEPLDTTWKVYRIADSQLVVPLANRPVVWKGDRARPVELADAGRHLVRRTRHGGTWSRRPTGRPPGPGCPIGRPGSAGGARAGHHGLGRAPDRRGDLLPRRPGGYPGRGPGLLLPELARHRGRRAPTGWRPTSWWWSRPATTSP